MGYFMVKIKRNLLLIAILSFFTGPFSQVYAIDVVTHDIQDEITSEFYEYSENIDKEISDALEEEGLNFSSLTLEENKIMIDIMDEQGNMSELVFELGSNQVESIFEKDNGDKEKYIMEFPQEEKIDAESIMEDGLDISIEEESTGEIFEGTELQGELSAAVPAIPIGIPIAWNALMAMLKIGFVIIVAGLTYVFGQTAILSITNNRNNKYAHYRAVTNNNQLYIGDGISEKVAVSWLKQAQSTWSTTKNGARVLAQKMGGGNPINEIDRQNGKAKLGHYWHYHSGNRKPAGHHAFYGGPATR